MKKLLCVALCVVVIMLSLCACTKDKKVSDEMFALDTFIKFTVYGEDEKVCKDVIDDCKSEIMVLETKLSATRENSDVYSINNGNGESVEVSQETADLIQRACVLSQSCGGAFDISVYPLVKMWGFDTKEYAVPSDDYIKRTLKYVNYNDIEVSENKVKLKENMSIDLGAIAKGYIGECVYNMLKNSSVSRAVVNLGGMVILYNGDTEDEKFSVGIEHPESGEIFVTMDTAQRYVVTSGAYQRYFEQEGVKYHHIIDPQSGKPSESDISSVTVVGERGIDNDALSTAFFVMGKDKTIEYIKKNGFDKKGEYSGGTKYSVVILNEDLSEVYISSDLVDDGFELTDKYKDKIKVNIIEF